MLNVAMFVYIFTFLLYFSFFFDEYPFYKYAPRSDLSDVEANVPAVVQVNSVNQQPERSLDHVDLTVEQFVTLSDTEDVD